MSRSYGSLTKTLFDGISRGVYDVGRKIWEDQMSKRTAALGAMAVTAAVFLAGGVAAGCGDKFVVLGRGVRFARAKYPARIVIYKNPASHIPAADKEYRLESTLKLAGHKPSVAESSGDVQNLLHTGKYDLVLGDISDADSLAVHASSSGATVIPVVYNPTGAELADAQRQYNCLVKASKKNTDLISVIDEAMLARSKGAAANCAKTR